MLRLEHQRELDIHSARRIREDYLHDDDLMKDVRCRLGQDKCYSEAMGRPLTDQDYVEKALEYLAQALRARHGL